MECRRFGLPTAPASPAPYTHLSKSGRARIPKGFRPKAQGCEERATLGNSAESRANTERVVTLFHPERREAEVATLSGLALRPRSAPRVARSSQPWAGGLNPFGIGMHIKCRGLLLFDAIRSHTHESAGKPAHSIRFARVRQMPRGAGAWPCQLAESVQSFRTDSRTSGGQRPPEVKLHLLLQSIERPAGGWSYGHRIGCIRNGCPRAQEIRSRHQCSTTRPRYSELAITPAAKAQGSGLLNG